MFMENDKKNSYQADHLPFDTSSLLNSILKNSRVAGIFIMDEKGTILRANPGALKYFGYTEEDVIGKNFSLLFTKEDKSTSNPEKELKMAVETGSGLDDNFIVHKDGRHLWCHGESILAKDEKGKIFIVKIVFDIDKQRRLEEALSRTIDDLNNFVFSTSHDLKAPINNIQALVEIFCNHSEIKGKYEEEIELIKKSIAKFQSMLNDLSILGKNQENARSDVAEIKLSEMVDEIKLSMYDQIYKTNTTIRCDFSEVPVINYSRKNFRSILLNLISNAIKFHSPLRDPEIIIISQKLNKQWTLLIVKDNGIGIKEEDKNKVFAMYGRLNKEIPGTGVGMALVARIVDSHGGKIQIESEPGKGSSFYIYIKNM
jgi:PAS domain S-box-containing protein